MNLKTTTIIGFIVVVAVLISVGAIVAASVSEHEKVARVVTAMVAVLSLLITAGKTAYDIYDKEHERQKKADERQERVRVTVRYGHWDSTAQQLGVIIYNEGSTPIHVQSVLCHFKPQDGADEICIPLISFSFQTTELIGSKDTARFRDMTLEPRTFLLTPSPAAHNIWITVHSYQGEIYRVPGEEILKALGRPG